MSAVRRQAVYVRFTDEERARFRAAAFKTPMSETKIGRLLMMQWTEAQEQGRETLDVFKTKGDHDEH